MALTLLDSRNARMLLIISVILGIILISLPFWSVTPLPEVGVWAALGRLHPLIVHFPIVLIVLPLLLEGLIYWKKWTDLKSANRILLPLAIVSSSMAVFMGFFLYRSGSYGGELVNQHLWGGIFVSLACLITGLAFYFSTIAVNPIWRKIYLGSLMLANMLTVYTGHLGGSLTHGENYLSEALPELNFGAKAPIELKSPEEMLVFDDIVMSVFQSKCLGCHNEHKAKGGLIMATYEDLLVGGKSEKKMLVASSPDSSELYHRIALEDNHDDHMPPPGKPDLNEGEIALIHEWITSGASTDLTLAESSPTLQQLAKQQLPQLMRFQRQRFNDLQERNKTFKELKELTKHLHLRVEMDPNADSMLFALSMQFPPALVNDETLTKLLPYANAFSKISLPSAEITDEGLYTLSQFPNIRQLYLQKTCIEGDGLIYLKSLSKLESLSLAHTKVDDVYALDFLGFDQLKELYLHHTEVGVNVIRALDKRLKNTKVLSEEGPYY